MKTIHFLVALVALSLLAGCGAKNSANDGGAMLSGYDNLIDVRLEGANEPALTEIFGKVVNSAPTVVSAKQYAVNIVADNPQACWLIWRAEVKEGGAFQLQTDMMDMFGEIYRTEGFLDLYGVPYRYAASEVDLLKGVRVSEAISKRLRFIIDRELARDKEMAE